MEQRFKLQEMLIKVEQLLKENDKSIIKTKNNMINTENNLTSDIKTKNKKKDNIKKPKIKNNKKGNTKENIIYTDIIKKFIKVEFDYYNSNIDIMNYFKYCSPNANYVYFKCVYRRINCPGTIKKILLQMK